MNASTKIRAMMLPNDTSVLAGYTNWAPRRINCSNSSLLACGGANTRILSFLPAFFRRLLMRTVCKIIVAALALIAAAILDSAGAQEMKEKTAKEQIVGTWWVVSAVNEMDGKKTESFGSAPKGQFMFTADGHFSTNIIRPGRPKFASNNRMTGTPEENKEAVAGNVSNFGSYAINSDGSITLEITGSSFPNRDGTKQKRLAEIKGDEMKWTNPTASMGGTSVIMLQLAKSGDRYPQSK